MDADIKLFVEEKKVTAEINTRGDSEAAMKINKETETEAASDAESKRVKEAELKAKIAADERAQREAVARRMSEMDAKGSLKTSRQATSSVSTPAPKPAQVKPSQSTDSATTDESGSPAVSTDETERRLRAERVAADNAKSGSIGSAGAKPLTIQALANPSLAPSSSSAPELDPARLLAIDKRIRAIYRAHNPSKLSEVTTLLLKAKGQEELLLQKIEAKYNVDSSSLIPETLTAATTGVPTNTSVPPEAKPSAATAPPPSSVSRVEEIENRIRELYREYNPAKLPELPSLMSKYKGQEESLLGRIEAKCAEVQKERADKAKAATGGTSAESTSLFAARGNLPSNSASTQVSTPKQPSMSSTGACRNVAYNFTLVLKQTLNL